MPPFDGSHTSSYLSSIVTTVLCCIISEIERDIGRKSRFFIPLLHDNLLGKTAANIFTMFLLQPSQILGVPISVDRLQ